MAAAIVLIVIVALVVVVGRHLAGRSEGASGASQA